MRDSNHCFPLRTLPFWCLILIAAAWTSSCRGQAFTLVQLADGFDYPVGKPDAAGYYVYRGFTQHGHLGEDWNGNGGSNTDLGDPVYSIAHGIVIFSEDYKRGWGNVAIIRHAYRGKNGQIQFVDSLYGHLHDRYCKVGERVTRGQKIGTIGRGPHNMYLAHLHFEIRKDLRVGMRRDLYPKTFATYYVPRVFMDAHRTLRFESRLVRVPINTFQRSNPNKVYTKSIEPADVEISDTARPFVPETTGSVISEQTDPEDATPDRSKSLLDRLFGR